MKISNSNLSFQRLLTPIEKIETRAAITDAKKAIGLDRLAIVTHSISFPSDVSEDVGIGILSDNRGTNSYINFLYDNGFDMLSIEPMGRIRAEFYSPYDSTLLSKKQIVDLKQLCTDEWANILDIETFNEIVKNKDYNVQIPTGDKSNPYKTVRFSEDMALYDYVIDSEDKAIRKAYKNFRAKVEDKNPKALELDKEFSEFKKENNYYLKGDAIYFILHKANDYKRHSQWENPLHRVLFNSEDESFSPSEKLVEILKLEEENFEEIEFYKFFQFIANKQQKDFINKVSSLSLKRYESDMEIIEKAHQDGLITKGKYNYLIAKIQEYKKDFQGVNVIGDKQVGYSDADIFSNPTFFTKDEFMGAPPNFLKASKGQDWNFPFIPYEKMFNKDGSLNSGGLYLQKVFKKYFEDNVGGVRIDHVIGLIDPWTYKNEPLDKKTPLSDVSDLKVACGSRHVFKYLLNNELFELAKFNLNEETIKGVIDPIKGIFDENSLDRKFLIQNGVQDFDEIKEVILTKQNELDKVYSNVIEKIILEPACKVVEKRFKEQGIQATREEIFKKACSLIICEDLGAITIPVKSVMQKFGLTGMRDASRGNPYDTSHYFREINPQEQGNFWVISTHDTDSYKNTFLKFDESMQKAHIDYVADEMKIDKAHLSGKKNLLNFIHAKVARILLADKNPKTPNNVMLNWMDIFGVNKQYNKPGVNDKARNWVLRICGSNDSFEKRYYEDTLPQKQGVNILSAFALALKSSGTNNEELVDELERLADIACEKK